MDGSRWFLSSVLGRHIHRGYEHPPQDSKDDRHTYVVEGSGRAEWMRLGFKRRVETDARFVEGLTGDG